MELSAIVNELLGTGGRVVRAPFSPAGVLGKEAGETFLQHLLGEGGGGGEEGGPGTAGQAQALLGGNCKLVNPESVHTALIGGGDLKLHNIYNRF